MKLLDGDWGMIDYHYSWGWESWHQLFGFTLNVRSPERNSRWITLDTPLPHGYVERDRENESVD